MKSEFSLPSLRVDNPKLLLRNVYEVLYQKFDAVLGDFDKRVYHVGLSALNAQKGEHILEIGFGKGSTLIELAEAVGRRGTISGIEINERKVARARNILHKAKMTGWSDIRAGDAVDLPFPESSFDGIYMAFALDALEKDKERVVLAQCLRVLRAGGRIVVVSMAVPEKPGLSFIVRNWIARLLPGVLVCRPVRGQELLESSGFRVTVVRPNVMWGLPVEVIIAYNPLS